MDYGDRRIEVVNEYNYLGLVFNFNAKFNVAKNSLYQKGSKAMFSSLKKKRKMSLPFDVAIKLFKNLVKAVVLYGAEVWGYPSYNILERLQLRYVIYKQVYLLKHDVWRVGCNTSKH